jgi:hypothetical protein
MESVFHIYQLDPVMHFFIENAFAMDKGMQMGYYRYGSNIMQIWTSDVERPFFGFTSLFAFIIVSVV